MRTNSIAQANPNEETLERLVERTLGGDERAWREVWLALDPMVEDVARRPRITGRLARCEDARRDVVVRVMEELRRDGFRGLVELGERLACRDGSFRPWLFRLARNVAVSYVRAHAEQLGRAEDGARQLALHVPLTDAIVDERSPPSRRIDARRILDRAREVLDPAQLDALCLWLRGDDVAEIAAALREDEAAAVQRVRSAVKRLRRRFAP